MYRDHSRVKNILMFTLLTLSTATVIASPPAHRLQKRKVTKSEGNVKVSPSSKTAKFGVISTTNSEVKHALKATDLKAAMKLGGKKAVFIGIAISIYSPKSHSAIIVDMANPYKNAITLYLPAASFSRFPNMNELKGKKILVTGKVFIYKAKFPEITLVEPDQIKLIK